MIIVVDINIGIVIKISIGIVVKIKIVIVIEISIVTIHLKQERTWRNYWTGLCGQTLQRVVSKFKIKIKSTFLLKILYTNTLQGVLFKQI